MTDVVASLECMLAQGIVASSSTPVQLNDDTQSQKRSRKNLFQRVSVFLAGVMGIRSMRINDVEIRTTATKESTSQDESNWQISSGSDTDMPYFDGRIIPTPNLRIFSFSELRNATKNFKIDNLLGEGRFGTVYKGWLDAKVTSKNGSGIVVAIKHTVGPLCGLSHSNLVKILGYCWVDQELFLVYEFMQNGSLEQHLFGRDSVLPLPWDIRLKIPIGAAQGLAFLHSLETPIVCREFKASNILLDESFNSKISDFSYGEYVPTRYPGTHPVYESYIAPEYVRTGHVHVKGDVYSFGVVLLEMLTGLCAWDTNHPHQQRNPVGCVKPYLADQRKLATVIDSRLEGRYPRKAALQIAHLSLHCLEDKQPVERPSMKQVVETLESISTSNGKPLGA